MDTVAAASRRKVGLDARTMLLKGFLAGALLAYATAFAFRASLGLGEGPAALVSAAVFPVGFAMIVLLGLELVTGNFAVLPIGIARGGTGLRETLSSWGLVYLGNLVGSLAVALLLALALTEAFTEPAGPLGAKLVAVARAKTLAYEHAGAAGWLTALVKAILCNWMVAIGTILGFSTTSTVGRIAAVWLPIMTFFGLSLEHSVVNMFVIPSAMLLDAGIGLGQWWIWNQVPVTLGNLVGGAVLTGLLLHYMHADPRR